MFVDNGADEDREGERDRLTASSAELGGHSYRESCWMQEKPSTWLNAWKIHSVEEKGGEIERVI